MVVVYGKSILERRNMHIYIQHNTRKSVAHRRSQYDMMSFPICATRTRLHFCPWTLYIIVLFLFKLHYIEIHIICFFCTFRYQQPKYILTISVLSLSINSGLDGSTGAGILGQTLMLDNDVAWFLD